MARTGRHPQQVMDEALWGIFQTGYTDGFGSDADHLKTPADLADCLRAGFTLFTIDPGDQVDNQADTDAPETLLSKCRGLGAEAPDLNLDRLRKSYLSGKVKLPGGSSLEFSETELLRAAVKYGRAIKHTVMMYQTLKSAAAGRTFELEMSVDETLTPTTVGEHYFVASELARAGVTWVSLAPRFVGRFEKGVDYIGNLDEFRKELIRHRAVARQLGNYKISIHSGSDKFSLYPTIAEVTEGRVHLKTAGTSYLEAVRTIADTNPELYRAIYRFARERYETDRASYHVSAKIDRVPPENALSNGDLEASLDDFHTRQMLHVTFGSVLTARTEDGSYRFRTEFYRTLEAEELEHYRCLAKHLGRHARPFAR
ncbi:MAG: hypothetical protein BWY73_00983 [candidate division TA06 bacterium ADurb.Bin417]|uniref:Tagaturonate/fructuronate epimerase n=1 Tax=candidate division TA06 bacterium ADurb.Bin417 TaxID=1852828 RepID=A0A1V5MF82_UNCT6|nr:MAG: hypothetical protein BWY73_00983 [candidate division TA06 bacterium ADurb.Bin417]